MVSLSNDLFVRKTAYHSNLQIFKKFDVRLCYIFYEFNDLKGTVGNLL